MVCVKLHSVRTTYVIATSVYGRHSLAGLIEAQITRNAEKQKREWSLPLPPQAAR